ncbi:MAG: hypothetical protein JW849_07820, partial [Phycisphaerae bacterium]|nr:hypothetical protein [Phycisphaerae bacterium]
APPAMPTRLSIAPNAPIHQNSIHYGMIVVTNDLFILMKKEINKVLFQQIHNYSLELITK